MTDMNNLNHDVTFSPQINPEQIQAIADKGFKTVVCNRPDNEEPMQPTMDDIAKACESVRLAFKAVPYSGGSLTQEDVEEFAAFFNTAEQPVYMYCRSGNRSNLIYQAAIQMNLLK